MTCHGLKVIVSGAGIGGLAVALALRARGADVTVLEQAPEISEVGAGLQISPNGMAVLRALGVADALEARSMRARAVVLCDYIRKGEVLRLTLPEGDERPYLLVHRSDLIDVLAAAARAKGVQVRLLQQVERVEDADDGACVHMRSGARLRADLVIGADGLHSVMRPMLNTQAEPFFTGQVAWRALVPNRWNLPAEARVTMAPGRHIVSYPLRDGAMVNLVAVEERDLWADEGWHHRGDPDELRHIFADVRGPARELLNAVETVHLWGLFRHPVAQHWHGRACAMVGDAAHPTLPFLAQGANMALEDAFVLARCLDDRTATMAQALAAYQAARHSRVTRVIAAANSNAWKYHLRGPVRHVAHLALGVAGRLAPSRMVSQFDWLYGHDVTA